MSAHVSIGTAVQRSLGGERVLLAVSGGVDSMVLLHAAAAAASESVVGVATFDHGTGRYATNAVRLVRQECARLGLAHLSEVAPPGLRTEMDWREARWSFLKAAARDCGGGDDLRIATAHTRDDNIETVVMRVMRGSGAWGLAALYAPGGVLRPLLHHSRKEVLGYARAQRVTFVEDPSNLSLAHLRNRVRLHLLPALRGVDERLPDDLLRIAGDAEAWRRDVDALVAALPWSPGRISSVDVESFALLTEELARTVAPAVAARAGITLDRRGVVQLSSLLAAGGDRGRIQLSGGYEVWRRGSEIFFQKGVPRASVATAALRDGLIWGNFCFRRVTEAAAREMSSGWVAALPESAPTVVRHWSPGDRMVAERAAAPRRVKRFLSDMGIRGAQRGEWPVVECQGSIVWIPGVRLGSAAEWNDSGGLAFYECERVER